MTMLRDHPERNVIRLQLKQNVVLQNLDDEDFAELEPHLVIVDGHKGDFLLYQGVREMETSYAAWRLGTPTPYGIVCVTKARVARLPLEQWVAFLEKRSEAKTLFEYSVMRGMSEIMAHTITLHLLDAPGRLHRFLRKHPKLVDRIPGKELAAYLNLSAETLSRLRHSAKV